MRSFKKHFLFRFILLIIILSSCKIQDSYKSHGIVFLENRSNKLILNKTNKNDVINIFGQPQILDINDNDRWIYLERTLSKGKYHELGKHKIKDNNVLVLSFNKYGILNYKELLTKNEINKIKFSDKKTDNIKTKKSFVQSFLQSVKSKMYSNRK